MTYLRNLLAHAVPGFGVLCLFADGGSPLYAQEAVPTSAHPCAVRVLLQPSWCAVTLAPGQSTSVSLAVEEGTMRMLRAEQLDGAVELRLAHAASSAGEPFANQARVHSRISVLLASGDQITLSNPAKDGPAKAVSGFFNIYA